MGMGVMGKLTKGGPGEVPERNLIGVIRACGRGQGVKVGVVALMAPPPPRLLLQQRKTQVRTGHSTQHRETHGDVNAHVNTCTKLIM